MGDDCRRPAEFRIGVRVWARRDLYVGVPPLTVETPGNVCDQCTPLVRTHAARIFGRQWRREVERTAAAPPDWSTLQVFFTDLKGGHA